MEFKESYYYFQIPEFEMESFVGHEDVFTLKMQDHSDNYLFNYLLNPPNHPQEHFFDGLLQPHQHSNVENSLNSNNHNHLPSEIHILQEISPYICLRTTPLTQILNYIDQYYPLNKSNQKTMVLALRKYKLKLKREHAKNKITSANLVQPEIFNFKEQQDIKVEDSPLSPIYFQEESQETKKKKRNRMSAQNSRDRKKEYIKTMEMQNQELRKQLKALSAPKPIKNTSKQFFKMLLCMGITCFVNNNNGCDNCYRTGIIDDYTCQEKTPLSSLAQEDIIKPKVEACSFDYYQKLLPIQNQEMIDEVLGSFQDHECLQMKKNKDEALAKPKASKSKRMKSV